MGDSETGLLSGLCTGQLLSSSQRLCKGGTPILQLTNPSPREGKKLAQGGGAGIRTEQAGPQAQQLAITRAARPEPVACIQNWL